MKFPNPLKMNDWPINNFLVVVLTLQISLLVTIGLNFMGYKIPILRELIGFFYLTFVPGILILRILRLHNITSIEVMLYSVGISVSSLMFIGFFLNMLNPLFGVLKPLSMPYILTTMTGFVILLSILSYIVDKDYSNPDYIILSNSIFNQLLFLALIPFFSIFGSYLMNFYGINWLILILIILVSIIFLLVSLNKIDKKLHTFALFVISISLLYQGWLISTYIWGADSYYEFGFSKMIIENCYWNWVYFTNTAGMMSITILGPVYYQVSNLDLTWIFKIVYPFLFSLVPLGLYQIFKNQTNERIAFLSSFFFVSTTFYSVWVLPFKQELAELYIVLLTLILLHEKMDGKIASLLLILFGFSLIVSHYGTSYLYVMAFVIVWILSILVPYISNRIPKPFFLKNLFSLFSISKKAKKINLNLVVLFIVFLFAWYIYLSNASILDAILKIAQNITSNLISEFLSPETVQGMTYVTQAPKSIYGYIHQFLYLLTSLLIVIGVLSQLFARFRIKFESNYYGFSFMSLIILIATITIPYFGKAMHTQRIYQLCLLFLAPFCIIGGITVFRIISSFLSTRTKKNSNMFLNVFSIFLVIFFLFNIGFVDEIANTHRLDSISFSHDNKYIHVYGQDIYASNWLKNNYKGNIYFDKASASLWVSYGGLEYDKLKYIDRNITLVRDGAYIYFGYQNLVNNLLIDPEYQKYNMSEVNSSIIFSNKIYSSGGTEVIIFKKPK